MLQERGPRQKTRLMTDIITFGVGNSTILNQGGKTKILAKMKNERPSWQSFLTINLFGLEEGLCGVMGDFRH